MRDDDNVLGILTRFSALQGDVGRLSAGHDSRDDLICTNFAMPRLDLFDKPIDPSFHLLGGLASRMFFRRRATVGPDPPIRLDLFYLVRMQSLVCTVIPLDNVLAGLEWDVD